MKYILWNTTYQGWMSHGSYNSDRAYAKEYSREEAFEMAKGQFKAYGMMRDIDLIPVAVADYDEVKA
jgi:hypothetical protein